MIFLTQAPARDISASAVAIKIALMSIADAQLWHHKIQPAATKANGSDRKWNWPSMRRWLPLSEIAFGRRAPAYTVWAEATNNKAVPVGMVLLSEGYASLDGSSKKSVYMWFMSAAPDSVMRENGLSVIPKLGRVLIDIGVTHSHNCGYGGRIGLHAAPEGGDKLFAFYKHIGMSLLPGSAILPKLSRINDGRYFYFDALQAKKWSDSLNSYR